MDWEPRCEDGLLDEYDSICSFALTVLVQALPNLFSTLFEVFLIIFFFSSSSFFFFFSSSFSSSSSSSSFSSSSFSLSSSSSSPHSFQGDLALLVRVCLNGASGDHHVFALPPHRHRLRLHKHRSALGWLRGTWGGVF